LTLPEVGLPVSSSLHCAARGAVGHSLVLTGLLLGTGCSVDVSVATRGDETQPIDDSAVRARFELAAERMPFGSIPWPDDLYRDGEELISVGHFPGEINDNYLRSLRESLRDLDGFSAVSPVYFYFDGDIDPESINGENVFLMDFETGSPESLEKVPIAVHWYGPERQLSLRPARGHPLRSGHKYAAVVTGGIEDVDGNPIEPSPAFAEIRDAEIAPDRPLSAKAYDQYAPVFSGLSGQGVEPENVVALAVFTVQNFGNELEDARRLVEEKEVPAPAVSALFAGEELDGVLGIPVAGEVGLDAEGGAPHDHIGWMAQGSFRSPYLLSRTANAHGRIQRNESGELQVKAVGVVPFTLWLPRSLPGEGEEGLPVVLFQHGLGGERSDGLSVANALAKYGYAVFAVDAPLHGLRVGSGESDNANRFTSEQQPDGFGDVRGPSVIDIYAGVEGAGVEAVDFNADGIDDYLHPVYWRDATRQAVIDLAIALRLLGEGDWSSMGELDVELQDLRFDVSRIGFVGVDLGGQIGALLALIRPEITALYLAFCGGHLAEDAAESPALKPVFDRLLEKFGRQPEEVNFAAYHPVNWPEIAVWQTLMDRGDLMAFAPMVRLRPVNVLMAMARNDEVASNIGTESLGRALEVEFASDSTSAPQFTDMLPAQPPVFGNVTTGDERVTRVLFQFNRATHGLLFQRNDVFRWKHPVRAPLEPGSEEEVVNPIEEALGQMSFFFETWRSGVATVRAPE
jgi:pimeloyl-ACP methyl ester carboxylesterase